MIGFLRSIALIAITIVATVFFVQNLATTEVSFLTWSIAAPRAVIFLLVLALGWAGGYLSRTLKPQHAAKPSKRPNNSADTAQPDD